MEKSVIESLSAEELDKVAGEDNSFLATYSIVEEKSNYISRSSDSARWYPLTYARLHNFIRKIESSEFNTPLLDSLRRDWETKSAANTFAADSIIAYWSDYLNYNNPDSLVSAVYDGIEVERVRNSNKGIDTLVKVRLKLKALKCTADSLLLTYRFDTLHRDTIALYRKITDSSLIKIFPTLHPDIKNALIVSDSSIIVNCNVLTLYSEGKCYNMDTLRLAVPETVLQYIDGAGSKEEIIKSEVDREFTSLSAYLRHNAEDHYKKIDSLAYSYTIFRGEQ